MPVNKTGSARARGLRKAKKKNKIKEVVEAIKARGDVVVTSLGPGVPPE